VFWHDKGIEVVPVKVGNFFENIYFEIEISNMGFLTT
jgi:hypothetical protein